ncbi:hypothetical protein BV25DRAFT_849527 [Artomyces pyxidatus]|uniref:Uncharacterized protein n=1 Tax=Artomyces pyxidatus TaxID=48021 RepID=A0ACB8TH22_9AGAM|nr:hypothetical protein BV25DRAFT_849527 [Artomyces pyxidatus]
MHHPSIHPYFHPISPILPPETVPHGSSTAPTKNRSDKDEYSHILRLEEVDWPVGGFRWAAAFGHKQLSTYPAVRADGRQSSTSASACFEALAIDSPSFERTSSLLQYTSTFTKRSPLSPGVVLCYSTPRSVSRLQLVRSNMQSCRATRGGTWYTRSCTRETDALLL